LRILEIRGNVDTRVRKTLDPAGQYDAVVLAVAGLKRLGLDRLISLTLPFETMLPAPGQGALAVQCRQEAEWLALFGRLDDSDTRAAVAAERAFLAGLGGGCSAPVAALGERAADDGRGNSLRLWGRICALDGARQIDAQLTGTHGDAEQLGRSLAQLALTKGAREIIDQIAESEDATGADR
jgi:hydroxymethylbilane synthase